MPRKFRWFTSFLRDFNAENGKICVKTAFLSRNFENQKRKLRGNRAFLRDDSF